MSYDPEDEIKRYLKRLARAARDLPRARRRELLSEIEQHIRQAIAEMPRTSQAELLTLLDQVGDPAEIVAAAGDQPEPSSRSTKLETAAIVLLLVGGFLWGVGWLVGVVLLWSSGLWTLRDKLVGTLIVPGGLATAFLAFAVISIGAGGPACTSSARVVSSNANGRPPVVPAVAGRVVCRGGASTLELIGIAIGLAVLAIAPIATSVYLGRRLNKQKRRLVGGPSAALG